MKSMKKTHVFSKNQMKMKHLVTQSKKKPDRSSTYSSSNDNYNSSVNSHNNEDSEHELHELSISQMHSSDYLLNVRELRDTDAVDFSSKVSTNLFEIDLIDAEEEEIITATN